MPQRPIAILEAPSVLGLFPGGVETLPDALLAAGLAQRLRARRAGRVEPPAWRSAGDHETGIANARAIAAYSSDLADAVGPLIDAGEFPLVLGGDCSILLGDLLALRRRGRYGLVFIDGDADFYQPEAEPRGEAASMDLALAVGRGPEVVTRLEGFKPLVRETDVVLLARKDAADAEAHGSQRVEDTAIHRIELPAVRALGAETAARRAVDHLAAQALEGFWIHLDADVLDPELMPAVDYTMDGGLTFEELVAILRILAADPRAVGANITVFNPKLDKDGAVTRAFADALARGFG